MPDLAGAAPSSSAFHRFLSGYALTYDIGNKWEYSNLGYWLLGEVLAARAGRDFKTLMQERVLGPMKLADTGYVLTPAMKSRLATGHDASLNRTRLLTDEPIYREMPAAGGIFSTATDLAELLAAGIGTAPSPLSTAMALTVRTRRNASSGAKQALGWTVYGSGDDELIFRDGGTLGFASCVVWSPAKRAGVVVLSNQVASVADIARHLLQPDFPLEQPVVTRHTEIRLDAKALDRLVGRYEADGEGVFTIVREGTFLTIAAPAEWGLPKQRLRPESSSNFFVAELPMRVTFETDAAGRATGIVIYPPRGQKGVPAKRLPD